LSGDTPSQVAAMLTSAFEHPMCHTKTFQAANRLFKGFRNEVLAIGFWRAVENCAGSKRMNRRRQKKFHMSLRSHKRRSLAQKLFPFSRAHRLRIKKIARYFAPVRTKQTAVNTGANYCRPACDAGTIRRQQRTHPSATDFISPSVQKKFTQANQAMRRTHFENNAHTILRRARAAEARVNSEGGIVSAWRS